MTTAADLNLPERADADCPLLAREELALEFLEELGGLRVVHVRRILRRVQRVLDAASGALDPEDLVTAERLFDAWNEEAVRDADEMAREAADDRRRGLPEAEE
jgi:hypothetical protein